MQRTQAARDLVEESWGHRDDSSRSSGVPATMKQMLLSDPILPEKSHQVLPHSRLVVRSDTSEAFLTGPKLALHVGVAAQPLETFLSRSAADEEIDALRFR